MLLCVKITIPVVGRANMERRIEIDRSLDSAKRRQASKLREIREALVAAGYNTAVEQAIALGVTRSTAWVVLNRDERMGPSAKIIKRILSSPELPPAARLKVKEYVEEKISGLYGHSKQSMRAFRDQFRSETQPKLEASVPPPLASAPNKLMAHTIGNTSTSGSKSDIAG